MNKGNVVMIDDNFEIVCGSGNIFVDFGDLDVEIKYMKVVFVIKIIGVFDEKGLLVWVVVQFVGVVEVDILWV